MRHRCRILTDHKPRPRQHDCCDRIDDACANKRARDIIQCIRVGNQRIKLTGLSQAIPSHRPTDDEPQRAHEERMRDQNVRERQCTHSPERRGAPADERRTEEPEDPSLRA